MPKKSKNFNNQRKKSGSKVPQKKSSPKKSNSKRF